MSGYPVIDTSYEPRPAMLHPKPLGLYVRAALAEIGFLWRQAEQHRRWAEARRP